MKELASSVIQMNFFEIVFNVCSLHIMHIACNKRICMVNIK